MTNAPLTLKFLVGSIAAYVILLIFGGQWIAVPLFKKIIGGGIEQEFLYIIYWGLILLAGYIALCTCLLSEYFAAHADSAEEKTNR